MITAANLSVVLVTVVLATGGCSDDEGASPADAAVETAGAPEGGRETGPDTVGDITTVGDGPSDQMTRVSFEGIYCSKDRSEDPFYECESGLACASTQQRMPAPGREGVMDFLCRQACTPTAGCTAGVCCPGVGRDGKPVQVCVPRAFCADVD